MDNETATPSSPAGFWLRAGAYMIDGVLVAAVSFASSLLLPGALGVVARLLLSAAYFTVLPTRAGGQTLGKRAAGVAIVRDDGSPLTYGRAFARWLGYLLSGLTLCLGFTCAAFTDRGRALHDYLAGTRVVRVEELGAARRLAVILAGLLFPLLIVLGVAAAVALPRFAGLRSLAEEGAAKVQLGALRAAVAAYRDDAKSLPAGLNALAPRYVPRIVPARASAHPGAEGVETYGAEACSGSREPGRELAPEKLRDTGKWGYVAAPGAPCDGAVFVDCTHPDSTGRAWYTY